MEDEMIHLSRGCMMPGWGKQSLDPGHTKYSAPGSVFAPRICKVRDQPHGLPCKGVQRTDARDKQFGSPAVSPRDMSVVVVDLKPRFTTLFVPVA